ALIAKTVLRDIKRLVTTRAFVDPFENAVEALGIDFTEGLTYPGIIHDRARTTKAARKQLARLRGVEAHHFARIIVDAVIIARTGRAFERLQREIERELETPSFSGFKNGPVETLLLQRCGGNIGRPEGPDGVE